MIERFIIDTIICNKCHKAFTGNTNLLCDSKAALKKIAEIMHKEVCEREKILCFAPKLVIKYSNVLDCASIGKPELEENESVN